MARPADYVSRIQRQVTRALDLPERQRAAELERIAEDLFAAAYDNQSRDDSPDDLDPARVAQFTGQLATALEHTGPDANPVTVAEWIATAAWNAATVAAAPLGFRFIWRTQRDDDVRDIHVPLEGVTNPVGSPFIVAGTPLRYPGEPIGPPEAWINCRCWLDLDAELVAAGKDDDEDDEDDDEKKAKKAIYATGNTFTLTTTVTDALVARNYDTAQRKQMADRGTAMPDGSYPIADEEDLRNAIQAIGRASDPDKVKAHIRKRAKALHLTALIPDSWTAAGEPIDEDELVARAGTSPPGTHDAPGWITHPRETERLRNYWTRGEGAAKIRWGQPGDFDRCRRQLRKYIPNPEFLAGTCANLHFVALGFWPGQPPHGRRKKGLRSDASPEETLIYDAFTAASQEEPMLPPRSFFEDPHLTRPTPMSVRGDGEYVGHLASWDTCHVGFGEDRCVTAPRSMANYAYFRTGEVETDGGPVAVGHITAGTGHAATDLGPGETVAHYDDTGTVVADVAVGEDEWGIWAHGLVRPGITPEQIHALRAGAPSGDWRRIGGNLELVGALIVNVPGFPIPRPELAASGERDLALVAAGIVAFDAHSALADKVAAAIERRMDEKRRVELVQTILADANEIRFDEITREMAEAMR